jgi:hypothetical protein
MRELASAPSRPAERRPCRCTELSFLTGTNPALHAHQDPELGLFRTDLLATGYPVTRLGYMEVARVAESDAAAPPQGALVAAAYGHRTGYRLDPLAERMVVLPSDLDPLLGIYVAHMGPICANGLLHAAADLCGTDVRDLGDGVRGRRVAVIGGGVVGLLTGLFARRHRAAEVVLLDPTPQRRVAAEGLGLEAVDPDRTDSAVLLKTRWRHGPGNRDADVVFQCRGRSAALATALRLLRPQGTSWTSPSTPRRLAAAPRRGVPPQRAHGPLRADRPGAPRHEPRVGPRAALDGDHRPAARRRRGSTQAHDHRRSAVRGGPRPARRPRRPAAARGAGGADVRAVTTIWRTAPVARALWAAPGRKARGSRR